MEHQVLTTSSETHDVEVFIILCIFVVSVLLLLLLLILKETKGTRVEKHIWESNVSQDQWTYSFSLTVVLGKDPTWGYNNGK